MTTTRRSRRLAALVALALLGASPVPAPAAPPAAKPAPRLPEVRLVALRDGLYDDAPEGDLARIGESDVGKLAADAGVDLSKTPNRLLAARCHGDRLFYVFYKTTANAFGDRAWLLQRIKKTERTWAKPDAKPEEKVTWQVEAFKLSGGALKRPDRHHGSFSLREAHRREIVKEYEIGFGEVPGVAEGTRWPFAADVLYRMLQAYQEEAGAHEKVRFAAAKKWTLRVDFDRSKSWTVASPELGFDAPGDWPDAKDAAPAPDAPSEDVVLEPGVGGPGVRLGESLAADLEKALGKPLEDVEVGRGHRLMSFDRSVTANLDPEGRLHTILTRPGFLGATKEGVRHGSTRGEVTDRLGSPKGQPADAREWTFPGLVVRFDAYDQVVRLVVAKPRAPK